MTQWLDKVFRFSKPNALGGSSDASDIDDTLAMARSLSMHRDNREGVVVVVELGSSFDHKTCSFVRQQYNFYTYRGDGDFHEISNLKAAFQNGHRVDRMDTLNVGRLVVHEASLPDQQASPAAEATPIALRAALPMPAWFAAAIEPPTTVDETAVDSEEMARVFLNELAAAAFEMDDDGTAETEKEPALAC
ncbi:MAG: hypothetical protein ACLQVD_18605 [Capsulimonadaceae bacterium]